MNINTIIKLKNNPQALEYLHKNSKWYRELNRKDEAYQDMISEMNSRKRIETTNKISNTIDNLELVSSILNVIK